MRGDQAGMFRGTLEIFTGGGKTLIGLACVAEASRRSAHMRLAVVVPTEALARQWRAQIAKHTDLPANLIGQLGGGKKDSFRSKRALVCVLNSAATHLARMAADAQPLMIVIDECHRAGAPTFSRALDTPAIYRLGLSATPEREEIDEYGEPIEYDEQVLGQKLGSVVCRFSLKDARAVGWLPSYAIHHHGVQLLDAERAEYESLSRQVDELADSLERYGAEVVRARAIAQRSDDLGRVAQAYVAATSKRKDLLYRAVERHRVAVRLIREAERRWETPRVLVFHERVQEATELYRQLSDGSSSLAVALEHSKLPHKQREEALGGFRIGSTQVLVSVKSLIEGIDVPEADVGISVASTSSVRQRIQSLGRVLRRADPDKSADMHILYVSGTVDEAIYAKEDWSDLTGTEANHYWHWSIECGEDPMPQDGPPRTPSPTEEQEWERLGEKVPCQPVEYFGLQPAQEYSVDTRGTVSNRSGQIIANPQGVAEMVRAVRGEPGGRFYVTPLYRLVLVWSSSGDRSALFAAGRLPEPFEIRQLGVPANGEIIDVSGLSAGDAYGGPTDRDQGTYALRQKGGGRIERKMKRGVREYASADDTASGGRGENARRVLRAWKRISAAGMDFHLNSRWHAWYLDGGEPRFLAAVPGGFEFPSDRDGGI